MKVSCKFVSDTTDRSLSAALLQVIFEAPGKSPTSAAVSPREPRVPKPSWCVPSRSDFPARPHRLRTNYRGPVRDDRQGSHGRQRCARARAGEPDVYLTLDASCAAVVAVYPATERHQRSLVVEPQNRVARSRKVSRRNTASADLSGSCGFPTIWPAADLGDTGGGLLLHPIPEVGRHFRNTRCRTPSLRHRADKAGMILSRTGVRRDGG